VQRLVIGVGLVPLFFCDEKQHRICDSFAQVCGGQLNETRL
jgi:hypothetical protein